MINNRGKWVEGSPEDKGKWCDMDYIADWIRKQNYTPSTDIENLIYMIIAHYELDLLEAGVEYYAPEAAKEWDNIYMINIPDLEVYVFENGGIKEFDYYC